MNRPFRLLLPLLLCSLLARAIPALADGWTANLDRDAPPDRLFVADKSAGALFRIDKRNGRFLPQRHACIHGRAEGDKQRQGDMKTPEGVYFILHKVKGELDFMEYGPHAFATDYPNPVDKLRRKTGGGIWLHSKGRPIKGITTRGCLAVEQPVITSFVGAAVPGTPIVIAEHARGGMLAGSARGTGVPDAAPSARASLAGSARGAGEGRLHAEASGGENREGALEHGVLLQAASATAGQEEHAGKGREKSGRREAAPHGGKTESTTDAPVQAGHSASGAKAAAPGPAQGPSKADSAGQSSRTFMFHELEQWLSFMAGNPAAALALYDAQRYSAASGESMAELEKRLAIADRAPRRLPKGGSPSVHVLHGPGYVVTFWRERDGRRLRILYWMPGEKGVQRIVGEKTISTPEANS